MGEDIHQWDLAAVQQKWQTFLAESLLPAVTAVTPDGRHPS